MELLGAVKQAGCDFGFTYDTVKTLSTALAALFKQQKGHMPNRDNVFCIGATIASYLMVLYVNEQECPLTYQNRYSPLMSKEAVDQLLSTSFGGITVTAGTDRKMDFYVIGQQCVSAHPFQMENGLFISMSPAIRACKCVTGVDLAEYGLGDIMIGG